MTKAELRKYHHADEISKLEDKHGTAYFHMALGHLFDCGHQNITEEEVSEAKTRIMEEAASNTNGGIPIMTPEFQCHLLDITLELVQFGLWDLLSYVKTDLFVG